MLFAEVLTHGGILVKMYPERYPAKYMEGFYEAAYHHGERL